MHVHTCNADALLQCTCVLNGHAANQRLTSDCAGAPGAGDLNFCFSTSSPSLMLRYLPSSGWRCTCRLYHGVGGIGWQGAAAALVRVL